jgi:CubicO group peptidase (beta-lactamase class C family)
MLKRLLVITCTCALLLTTFTNPATAQTPTTGGPEDLSELESFLDGVINLQLDTHNIAGAAVAVVRDGELFFSKGYGFSNMETGRRVDPAISLFRPGSVSKLFVWTAVMQLFERGQLDLQADVNHYLDFRIPDTYPQPVTMMHLMNHTPGFEEIGLGTFTRTEEELPPLGEYLRENIPQRVRPPGTVAAYSNYGTALAGYIIERISRMPYEQYIQENILAPLGMEISTFYQPLPPHLEGQMSEGYIFEGGLYRPGPFEYVLPAPAGAMSASPNDMANFMIAHLQLGQFDGQRILEEETARLMHSQSFTHDPRLPGMAHGWMEIETNQQRIIWHGGDTIYFHSALVLLPEHDLGLYVSYNSLLGGLAYIELVLAFVNHYFPQPDQVLPAPAENGENLAPFTGSYLVSRSNLSTYEKLLLFLQPVTVARTPDDRLQISGIYQYPTYWVQTEEPGVFHNIYEDEKVVFQIGPEGRTDQFFYGFLPIMSFIRMPWHMQPALHMPLVGFSLLVFLVTFLALPVSSLATRPYRRRLNYRPPLAARLALWLAWLLSLLALAFVIALVVTVADPEIVFGMPTLGEIAFLSAYLMALLATALVLMAGLGWFKRWWSLGGRILYSIVAAAGVIFLIWMVYWNVI